MGRLLTRIVSRSCPVWRRLLVKRHHLKPPHRGKRAEDVNGSKGDFLLVVTYLFIGCRTFGLVIACGGSGPVAQARAEVNEVAQMISGFNFL